METRKNSLSNNGLSMSQAQTISNLCNQKSIDIDNKINSVNNYSRHLVQKNDNGQYTDNNKYCIASAVEMPDNIIELLEKKAKYRACQAFLMENIKAKDSLLKETRLSIADTSKITIPVRPKSELFIETKNVDDEFGWSQLTVGEINDYLNAEAYAAHIGQFIHGNGKLNMLRIELPEINDIDYIEISHNEKSLVRNVKHHTSEQLIDLHEKLAEMHKIYEQKVNYYKAKVKNLTTDENTRIAKLNADNKNAHDLANNEMQLKYEAEMRQYHQDVSKLRNEFEIEKQSKMREYAAYRIQIDPLFQSVIDELMPKEK